MKTNNMLLVVAIIVLLVAGYFLFKKPRVVSPPITPEDTETVISGDSVFVDKEKTFSFSYPKKFLISSDGTVTIPKSFEPNTNFSEAIFYVKKSRDSDDLKNCLIPTNGERAKGTETISGVLYTKITLTDAGAGNFYDTTSYRAVHNGQCYKIEYTIHSTNIGNYSPEQGINEFDTHKVVNELQAIVRNFVFLESDISTPATKEIIIKPLEVLEDSRCPIYAKCIWMGTVRLKVLVTNQMGKSAETELTLGEPRTIIGVSVTLTEVMPAKTDKVLKLSDYTFTFSKQKVVIEPV